MQASESTPGTTGAPAPWSQRRQGMWFIDNPYSEEPGSYKTSACYIFDFRDAEQALDAAIRGLMEHTGEIAALNPKWTLLSEISSTFVHASVMAAQTLESEALREESEKLREQKEKLSRMAYFSVLGMGWYVLAHNTLSLRADEFDLDTIRHYIRSVPRGIAVLNIPADATITIIGYSQKPEREVEVAFTKSVRWDDLFPLANAPKAYDLSVHQEQHGWDDLALTDTMKERLKAFCNVAVHSGDAIAHILFAGTPSVDRQALVEILAKDTGGGVKSVRASSIVKPGDLAGVLTGLERGGILFVESIETLEFSLQESLITAMQDFKLDVMIDEGADARSIRLNLPPIGIIGSTDDSSKLSKGLLDQFVTVFHFKPLSAEGIAAILVRQSSRQKVTLEPAAALKIGEQSFGEMARAHKLLGWVSKYCHMKGCSSVEERTTVEAIRILTGENGATDSQESVNQSVTA